MTPEQQEIRKGFEIAAIITLLVISVVGCVNFAMHLATCDVPFEQHKAESE